MMRKNACIFMMCCILIIISGCVGIDDQFNASKNKYKQYLADEYNILIADAPPKVILDCDMTYMGDDAMCLSILVQADNIGLIDLVGVTIVGGNSFVAYGANSALVLLEQMDRADIPVYIGRDEPIGGVRDLKEQEQIIGRIDHYSALYNYGDLIPADNYHNLGKFYDRKWGYSETEPMKQLASDFMVDLVGDYPGEISIISIGPATNIAEACVKDASFACNVHQIIYIAGIIEGSGSFTPYSDFNCFYDPDAYDICMNADFVAQIIIPRAASDSARLDQSVFERLESKDRSIVSSLWIDKKSSEYKRNPNKSSHFSDAIAGVRGIYAVSNHHKRIVSCMP